MKNATYYLISTINGKANSKIYGIANTKEELIATAESLWGKSRDIYDETLYKNYMIISKSSVIKMFGKKFIEF